MQTSIISQVRDIMNDNTKTAAAKRRDVVKLVGNAVEASQLISEWLRANPQPSAPALNVGSYTFGIELECYNVNARQLISECMSRGLQMLDQRNYYNHTDQRVAYKMVPDSTIGGYDPAECVSPILNGDNTGFNSIKNLCDSLNAIGAKVKRSCGYHVHVGGDITDRQYVSVFINYQKLQGLINTFMAPSRRNNNWAQTYTNIDLTGCTVPSDVYSSLHCSRYWSVNPDAWSRHRTIEFRQHAGTTNAKKVAMWAKFCLKLVAWSKNNRLTDTVTDIADVPFLTAAEKTWFKNRAAELSHEQAPEYEYCL